MESVVSALEQIDVKSRAIVKRIVSYRRATAIINLVNNSENIQRGVSISTEFANDWRNVVAI